MEIKLEEVGYVFKNKPLLIGGKAKEYYGIRTSGQDTDFVVAKEDYQSLAERFPNHKKDIFGDLGVIKDGFEIWQTICYFDYEYLSQDALERGDYLIISLEKLLFLTALGMKKEKYHKDLELIVQKILDNQTHKHAP